MLTSSTTPLVGSRGGMNGDSDVHLSESNTKLSQPVKNTFLESIPGYWLLYVDVNVCAKPALLDAAP